MEDTSLVNALQRNVNYNTQLSAISWRTPKGQEPSTFDEQVQAYSKIDNKFRQLKYRIPRAITANTAAAIPPSKLKTPVTSGQKPTSIVTILPVAPITLLNGDPMDLNSTIVTVKG